MNNTMVLNDLKDRFYGSRESLEEVYNLALRAKTIPGDFVECGIAMASGIMAMKLACPEKTVWGYDSFQGIHLAGPNDTEQPGVGKILEYSGEELVSSGITVHPKSQVLEILGYHNYTEEDFILVEGWVQETLPKIKPKKIAFLRLDMDLYEPTLVALQHLWPRLSKKGILLIDDGNLKGVVQACEDYFASIGYTPGWKKNYADHNPFYCIKG